MPCLSGLAQAGAVTRPFLLVLAVACLPRSEEAAFCEMVFAIEPIEEFLNLLGETVELLLLLV